MKSYTNNISLNKIEEIFSVICTYFIISISLVFLNKKLLSDLNTSIPIHLFIAFFQCFVTFLIIIILSIIGVLNYQKVKPWSIQLYLIVKILPLSICFVLMIFLNNLCLRYVEVSFYNIARSLTIVFNVILTYFILHEKTSNKTILCLIIIIIGFFVGSEGEINFSLQGTIFGVLSSIFVSGNAILTKKVMLDFDNNICKIQYYNSIISSLLFLLTSILQQEYITILNFWEIFTSFQFWLVMFISSIFGFLIGIVTILQINMTSPLTHNIIATVKSTFQTILAHIIFQNSYTINSIIGIVFVFIGSCMYTYIRYKQKND
jgi:GDP-fucose transporter C1